MSIRGLAVAAILAAGRAAAQQSAQPPTAHPATSQQQPAQSDSACDLYFENTPESRMTTVRVAPQAYNTYIGGGVVAHCRGQNNTMIADSAEHYDLLGLLYLFNNVHYREPRIAVDADHMTYYVNQGRLIGEGHVFAVMPSGSTMRGPWAEYLRVIPGIRTQAQLTALQRPHMHLVQQDSTVPPPAVPPPFPVPNTTATDTAGLDADRIIMRGDSLVFASGNVVSVRTDARTNSDSATFDTGTEFSRMLLKPMIVGTGSAHPFTLKGIVIDLYSAEHQLQRVVAKDHGDAVSQDLHLTADTIDLRLTDRQLERAYAWSAPRPFVKGAPDMRAHATTPTRDILADSLDVRMPGQSVHQIRAVNHAYGTSIPDTLKMKSTERDWIKGDTIYAWFDSTQAPPPPAHPSTAATAGAKSGTAHAKTAAGNAAPSPAPDTSTSSEPQIVRMLSVGDARSFYQLPPKDTALHRPAIDYVHGRTVNVDFVDKDVRLVTVTDSAAGLYLEPVQDSGKTDSLRVVRRNAADSIRTARRLAARRRHGHPVPADSLADTVPVPHIALPKDSTKAGP